MDLTFFFQVLISGVLLGGIYGLLALGMSLNLGLLNLINLAHGGVLVIAGVTAYLLVEKCGTSPVGVFLLIPLFFAALGGVSYPLLILPLSKGDRPSAFVSFLLITLGLAFLLEEVAAGIMIHPLVGLDLGLPPWQWRGLYFSPMALFLLLVLTGGMIILGVFLFWTKWGWALQALPQDPMGAALVGIPLPAAQALAWSLGLCAAALAGTFWIFLYPLSPYMGMKMTVTAMLLVMVVGPQDILRAVGAGWSWGLLESGGSALFGPQWGTVIPLGLFLGWAALSSQGREGVGASA